MNLRKAVDNLLLYDPEFDGYANNFVSNTGGSSEIFAVRCIDDLKTAIDSFTNVRFLEILLHGSPGMIHFANKGAMVGAYLGTLMQGKAFLQKNARILFDSCNIGEGKAGDVFMDGLAKNMLTGKGGIIGASTVTNLVVLPKCFLSSNVYLNPDEEGKLKVKRYGLDGKLINELSINKKGTMTYAGN